MNVCVCVCLCLCVSVSVCVCVCLCAGAYPGVLKRVSISSESADELFILKIWVFIKLLIILAEHYIYVLTEVVQYINNCINIAIHSSIESIMNCTSDNALSLECLACNWLQPASF